MSDLRFFRFIGLPPGERQRLSRCQPVRQSVDDIAVPCTGDETTDAAFASDLWHLLHPGALMLSRTQLFQ